MDHHEDDEIKDNIQKYRDFYPVFFGMGLVLIITMLLREEYQDKNNFDLSIVISFISMLFTVLVLDRLTDMRIKEAEYRALRNALKSRAPGVAIDAIRVLREIGADKLREAIKDSGKPLDGFDVSIGFLYWDNAYLTSANLEKIYITWITLKDADLNLASFRGACIAGWFNKSRLQRTNFEGAELMDVDFSDTYMMAANFMNVKIENADFSGANLTDADFTNAKLGNSIFSADTCLPNGQSWDEDTDMCEFTDPNHLLYQNYNLRSGVE